MMTYVLHLLYDIPPYLSCANFAGGCMNPFSINVLTSILLYAAHECNLETRNAQYSRICRNVFARSTSTWSCVIDLGVLIVHGTHVWNILCLV